MVKNSQDIDFIDNKLTTLDSTTVNKTPASDNEVSNIKYVDDKNTILILSQTLEDYLKVSVGNDTYNLTENDKIQIIDTIFIETPNSGGYLLQNWVIKYNDTNNNGKKSNLIRSTKTNSPTALIGDSFMYVETSSNFHGYNVFVSFERTESIQISNITFNYNRFSILTNDSLKSMGKFRIQIFLVDNNWSTQYNIP